MSAFVIDAFEFCRRNEQLAGEAAVRDLPRLAADLADGSGRVEWKLAGGRNALGHPQLSLAVKGDVKLVCQRCLTPFEFAIESQSDLVLADDEASADQIEASLEADTAEVIVGSKSFDARVLVEDEVLLALPISPRHEQCFADRVAGNAEREKQESRPSPFSVLRGFKQNIKPDN
jgi:uncharacterized protein